MRLMRSICLTPLALAVTLAAMSGCAKPQYGFEKQLTVNAHPVWAVAPAVNISGESHVDPLLQADLVFQQLQSVNNLTVIPVDKVVQVFAALHIRQVQSEEQAAAVCEQLGCDALVIPTITMYDPYDPPKFGVALQLMMRRPVGPSGPPPLDPHDLERQATVVIDPSKPLSTHPGFIQVVGIYDATDGSVRNAVLSYAKGRNDPCGPLQSKEYFVSMDRYCGFVYFTLIGQLVDDINGPTVAETASGKQTASTQPAEHSNGIDLTALGE